MLEAQAVTKEYSGKPVIENVDVILEKGKLTAFIGPNGAGKSTLLGMFSRLIHKDTGAIYLDGGEVKSWKQDDFAKRLSILRQSNLVNLNITVRELVNFGRFPYTKGRLKTEDHKKVDDALSYMGLAKMSERGIKTLSGGQLQRAYIAMVLAQDTDYILLDEPLNNLDMSYSVQMMRTIKGLVADKNKTIAIVLHDINFASAYADNIVALKDGKLFANGPTERIIQKPLLKELYGMDIEVCQINNRNFCMYF